jgi:hypothetical protein
MKEISQQNDFPVLVTMHSVLPHEHESSEGLDSSWMLQYVHPIMLRRILASVDTEKYKIDYNVLSVAAMTLGMIMMVEYMRHQLDHHAEHRPFFRVVLEGVYAECTFHNSVFVHFAFFTDHLSLKSFFL